MPFHDARHNGAPIVRVREFIAPAFADKISRTYCRMLDKRIGREQNLFVDREAAIRRPSGGRADCKPHTDLLAPMQRTRNGHDGPRTRTRLVLLILTGYERRIAWHAYANEKLVCAARGAKASIKNSRAAT